VVQTLISERAQISNHSIPPRAIHDSDHPFISYYDLPEDQEVGDCGLYHHLCILIQVLVRFYQEVIDANTDLYGTPYPHSLWTLNQRPTRRTSHLLGIRTPFDPSNPLRTSPPPTDYYGPAILPCGPPRTPSTRYEALPPATSFFRPFTPLLRTVIRPLLPATSPSHLLQATLTHHGLLLTLYTLCRRPML